MWSGATFIVWEGESYSQWKWGEVSCVLRITLCGNILEVPPLKQCSSGYSPATPQLDFLLMRGCRSPSSKKIQVSMVPVWDVGASVYFLSVKEGFHRIGLVWTWAMGQWIQGFIPFSTRLFRVFIFHNSSVSSVVCLAISRVFQLHGSCAFFLPLKVGHICFC